MSHDLVQVLCVPWWSRLCRHAPPRPISLAVWGSFTAQKHLRQSSCFFSRPPVIKGRNGESTIYKWFSPRKPGFFAFFHCHKSRVENLWEISTPGIKSRVPRDPQVTTHRHQRHQIARSSPPMEPWTESLDVF